MYNRNNKKQNKNMNTRPSQEKPKRRRRVNIDRNVEVLIVNNTFGRLVFNNSRMTAKVDMQDYGDDQYITVGDLKTMTSSAKKMFESFEILIVDILDDEYELEDLLNFVGLFEQYSKFFGNDVKELNVGDMNSFIINSSEKQFEGLMRKASRPLRFKIAQNSAVLIKAKRLSNMNKIAILEELVGEDVIADIRSTEVNEDLQI